MQDGATHMLNDVKNFPEGSIKKFDYEFDGDACTKCRFDVELNSGTPKLIEYKSWSLENIPNLSSRQMTEYFRSATSLSDIKYVFNNLKTPDVSAIKGKFKEIFENRAKTTALFNSLGESKFQQLFGVNIDDFIDDVVPVLDGPNSIYRFISVN